MVSESCVNEFMCLLQILINCTQRSLGYILYILKHALWAPPPRVFWGYTQAALHKKANNLNINISIWLFYCIKSRLVRFCSNLFLLNARACASIWCTGNPKLAGNLSKSFDNKLVRFLLIPHFYHFDIGTLHRIVLRTFRLDKNNKSYINLNYNIWN